VVPVPLHAWPTEPWCQDEGLCIEGTLF
jgi:hypothetical protein